MSQKKIELLFRVLIFLCFLPFVTPAIALLAGLALSFIGIKQTDFTKHTSFILQTSIVFMGFGMNLTQVISASQNGFLFTTVSVLLVMLTGILLGKILKTDSKTNLLIASGTAICGGSAIAAVSPIIGAKNYQISFSLVVVFVLNAVALIIFPSIGNYLGLSQETFGNWAAIAIHDTSAVVGAGATYGPKALEVATTVKLIRALWIIPLSLGIAFFQKKSENNKIKIPWFIGLFVLAIISAHLLPQWDTTFSHFYWFGKKGLTAALFLIGASISVAEIKQAGIKSFILGLLLWILTAGVSLLIFNTM